MFPLPRHHDLLLRLLFLLFCPDSSVPYMPPLPLSSEPLCRAQAGIPFTTSPASYLLVDSRLLTSTEFLWRSLPLSLLMAGLISLHSGGKDTMGTSRLYCRRRHGRHKQAALPGVPISRVKVGPSQPHRRSVRAPPGGVRHTGRKALGAEV